MKKDLNELNFEELKKEVESLEKQKTKATQKEGCPYQIGENYLIRTVTMIQLGKLVDVTDKEFVLESASWIADTGRFHDFLTKGTTDELEVEPFPEGQVIVNRSALIDAVIWNHNLPKQQK